MRCCAVLCGAMRTARTGLKFHSHRGGGEGGRGTKGNVRRSAEQGGEEGMSPPGVVNRCLKRAAQTIPAGRKWDAARLESPPGEEGEGRAARRPLPSQRCGREDYTKQSGALAAGPWAGQSGRGQQRQAGFIKTRGERPERRAPPVWPSFLKMQHGNKTACCLSLLVPAGDAAVRPN